MNVSIKFSDERGFAVFDGDKVVRAFAYSEKGLLSAQNYAHQYAKLHNGAIHIYEITRAD